MVGLSHVAFRLMLRHYLPTGATTLMPTEMLSTKRLPHQKLGHTPETFRRHDEDDLVPQILGNEERFIAPSIRKLEQWGARALDINMGCPVKQALKHNYGVSLMGEPRYAQEVVAMARKSTSLPLSVKLRAGHQKDPKFLLNFCTALQEGGANWLCLHPRLAEDKRRGFADWDQIRLLKEHLTLPIIGNGDIQVLDDVRRMREQTGADGVMIGRALTARPWLLWQIGEDLGLPSPVGFEGKSAPRTASEEAYAYGESLELLCHYLESYFDETQALKRLRFHLHVSHSWLNYGHSLKLKIGKVQGWREARACIRLFFKTEGLTMTQKTDLRY